MKSISIRELHERTGAWVRGAARLGGIIITDRGREVARLIPESAPEAQPRFARRKLRPKFQRFLARGRSGRESGQLISDDRER